MVKKITGEKQLDPCVLCKHLPNYDAADVEKIINDIKHNKDQNILVNIVSVTNMLGEKESHVSFKVNGNAMTFTLMDKSRLTEEFLRDLVIAYAKYVRRHKKHLDSLMAHAKVSTEALTEIHNEMRFM